MIMEMDFRILGELDHPNSNGIVYAKTEIEKAINEWKENKQNYGELNPDYEHPNHISLTNVSHKIDDIYIADNNVFAKIELLDTPTGKIAKQLINSGCDLKFAPRILGNVEKIKKGSGKYTGKMEVKDIDLITIDIIKP